MKGNYRILKILIVIMIVAAIAAVLFALQLKNPKQEETSSSATLSLSETSELTTQTTAEAKTEETTSETTTQEPSAAAEPAFIKGGYWYYFDKENELCYAFSFDGKGGVDLAMFDEENIEGGDTKYFEGYSTYSVDGSTIVIAKLPGGMKAKSITLDLGSDSISYQKTKLVHYDELKLGNVIKNF